MSSRAAQCPSCGGAISFHAGSSLLTVCPHCRAAVARRGVDVEAIGKVADLVPTSSPFKVGMRGKPRRAGVRPFAIVGRLQLSYGQGAWDEWHVAFDDGRYGWLAEAMGQFWLMRALPAPTNPPPPEFSQLTPGQRLDLSPYGPFTVTDRRQALYVSAEGDLPFASPPGSVFMYADLSGADGSLATLDYGDDPGVDAFFVGQQVQLEELGIEGLVEWGGRSVAAKASSLNCPNCGGGIELKDPQATVRVACPHCGSLLGAEDGGAGGGKFALLDALREVPFKPSLPLGSEGTLLGLSYVVLGAVRKSTESDGETYFWTEYLLKEKRSEAYHWLAESNGHWTLLAPVAAGLVEIAGVNGKMARFTGRVYKLFQRSTAKVEAVLGEFYWEVRRGELTQAADYVAPPRMLSSEQTGEEIAWTEGTYLDPSFLEGAFGLKERLAPPQGIGANQPWPREADAKAVGKAYWILLAALVALFVLFHVVDPKTVVFQKRFDLSPLASASEEGSPAAGAPEAPSDFTPIEPGAAGTAKAEDRVFLSEPFEIGRTGNVEVHVEAPSDNTWILFGGALLNEASGEMHEFSLLSDYYHGTDDGESWHEGSKDQSIYLSQVPKGRYVLRLEPEFEKGQMPQWAEVRLRAGVPRTYRAVLAFLFLALGPFLATLARASFEASRWADADTGGGSGSSDSSADSGSTDSSGSDE